ncbi:hypothetical protein [Streptomyces sp. NPDC054837]
MKATAGCRADAFPTGGRIEGAARTRRDVPLTGQANGPRWQGVSPGAGPGGLAVRNGAFDLRRAGAHGPSITSYEIHTSTDSSTFSRVASGTWAGDKTVKQARFGARSARYVRLVAVNTVGSGIAVAGEVNCGGIAARPTSSLTVPVQTPVQPGSDNSLSLTPALSALDNGGLKLENSPANIGYWAGSSDNATWRVRFDAPAPGRGDRLRPGRVPSTGSG